MGKGKLERVFFDRWGGAWTPCDATHRRARQYGPTGFSRPITTRERDRLCGEEIRCDESSDLLILEYDGNFRTVTDEHGWLWLDIGGE